MTTVCGPVSEENWKFALDHVGLFLKINARNSVFIRNYGHDYLLLTEISVYYWASIITRQLNAGELRC